MKEIFVQRKGENARNGPGHPLSLCAIHLAAECTGVHEQRGESRSERGQPGLLSTFLTQYLGKKTFVRRPLASVAQACGDAVNREQNRQF